MIDQYLLVSPEMHLGHNFVLIAGDVGSTMNGQDVDMSSEGQQQKQQQITVSDIDAEFLPQIYDIVKTVEKDPQDAATKNKESLEASEKVKELNKSNLRGFVFDVLSLQK